MPAEVGVQRRRTTTTRRKKFNYNWEATNTNFPNIGGGEFSQEQLQLAGIGLPERNSDRLGAQNIHPGDDGEIDGEEVVVTAPEDSLPDEATVLGRDQQPTGRAGAPASAPRAPCVQTPPPPPTARTGIYYVEDNDGMTTRIGLIPIPELDFQGASRTEFLCMIDLPRGVGKENVTATLDQDLLGLAFEFTEVNGAYDPEIIPVSNGLSYGYCIQTKSAIRGATEKELREGQQGGTLYFSNNVLKKKVHIEFPEISENYLYNTSNGACGRANEIHWLPS
ncbi:expressed unknown protein [Seminavis robusta]|uniref:Uncharacterized protein n=1 Tax=Seminavis robusta TaxID=568900 RepID=A0A9N8DJN3_9STRA|nr:expressed unknown protein [Seminavis robusta]|eukprot:Sro164_g073690.1 n/a (279) ;mRNA; f:81024-81998